MDETKLQVDTGISAICMNCICPKKQKEVKRFAYFLFACFK